MDTNLSAASVVKPKKAHDELLGNKDYKGLAIHTVRLAERVNIIAKQIYDDFYYSRTRCDRGSIYSATQYALFKDTKLTKNFSKGMLKVLAEGIGTQLILAF